MQIIRRRVKRYAELHGNMQRCRIKSRYGNKVNTALKLTETIGNQAKALNLAVKLSPMVETQHRISESFKAVESCLSKPKLVGDAYLGKSLPRYSVMSSCQSGEFRERPDRIILSQAAAGSLVAAEGATHR